MADFEKELKTARALFEKSLNAHQRIKQRIRHLSKSSGEYSTGKVALKIAAIELTDSRQKLDNAIRAIHQHAQQAPSTSAHVAADRDHFSEALALVDPKSRLQLGL